MSTSLQIGVKGSKGRLKRVKRPVGRSFKGLKAASWEYCFKRYQLIPSKEARTILMVSSYLNLEQNVFLQLFDSASQQKILELFKEAKPKNFSETLFFGRETKSHIGVVMKGKITIASDGQLMAGGEFEAISSHSKVGYLKSKVIESLTEGVAITDPSGRFVFVNQAYCKTLGYDSPSRIVGQHWSFVCSSKEEDYWNTVVVDSFFKEGHWSGEAFSTKADGTEILQHFSLSLLPTGYVIAVCRDLTTREVERRKLSESEDRFRLLADSAPVMIWEADPTGKIIQFNKTWLQFRGRTLASELTAPWTHDIHPDDLQTYESTYNEAIKNKTSFEVEFRLRRNDGYYRWIMNRGVPRYDKEGNFYGYMGSCIDIHERKLVSEANHRQKRDYQLILNSVQYLIFYIDQDHHILRLNKTAADFIGFSEEEIEGQKLDQYFPDLAKNSRSNMEEALRTGVECRGLIEELSSEHRETKWLKTDLIPYYDFYRRRNCLIRISQDITKQIYADKQLVKSQKELMVKASLIEATLSSLPCGIVVADHDGNYIQNPMTEKILGKNAKELFQSYEKAQSKCYNPETKEEYIKENLPLFRAMRGQHVNQEVVLLEATDTKQKIYLSVNARPLITKENEHIGGVAAFEDITERQRLISELLRTREKALVANQMKSQFITNMSHEIRTPLHGMIGLIDLIKESSLTKSQSKNIKAMEDSTNALLSIISDILDFSKIESKYIEFSEDNIILGYLIDDIIKLCSPIAISKNIALISNVDLLLNKKLVVGDPARLRRVLLNLVANAVKFTKAGCVEVDVQVRSETKRTYQISFEIRDTGIGIASKDLQFIFSAFTQIDGSTTREYGGIGLGLSISKNLIESMGGSIQVKSTPQKGSIFRFDLTFIKSEAQTFLSEEQNAPVGQEAHPQTSSQAAASSRLRILVVEDHEVSREVLVQALQDVGHHVEEAENGQVALNKLEKSTYDYVLLDLQMPVIDGYTVLKNLKKPPFFNPDNKTSVIVLTAHAQPEDRKKCFSLGVDAYLSKPVRPGNIIKMLRDFKKPSPPVTQEDILFGFDEKAFKDFKKTYDDEALFKKAMERIIKESKKNIRSIKEGVRTASSEKVARGVHQQISSCGLLGYDGLVEKLRSLERNCRNDVDFTNSETLTEIETTISHLETFVSNSYLLVV